MRNHLNTNADFKLATNVGRPDVMILIVRLMDLSTLSSMNRKNLLDANSGYSLSTLCRTTMCRRTPPQFWRFFLKYFRKNQTFRIFPALETRWLPLLSKWGQWSHSNCLQ